MSIETPEELEHLKAAGRVVAEAMRAMRNQVRPGIITRELDLVGARVFAKAGARSGPSLDYGFPGTTCISVNDEVVHGVPGKRRLRNGDLVKLDVTAELDGFYADACVSIPVGNAAHSTLKLVAASRVALNRALKTARAGVPINTIGRTSRPPRTPTATQCAPISWATASGVRFTNRPTSPNYDAPEFGQPLTEGLVITIEPIIAAGRGGVREAVDGWTIRTQDGSYAAHSEHTVVITARAPLILTA
jgi:methionyl aminopeptidase